MNSNAETSSFRFNASKVFLTYPQCNLSVQQLLEGLASIKEIKYYAIAQERHEDGNPHLHALCQFSSKINTVNQAYFDIQGFHPNIQRPRNIKDVLTYIKKDGEYISTWPEKRGYDEILSEATDEKSFLSLVKENDSKNFVLNHEKLEYFANKFYKKPTSPLKQIANPQPWRLPSNINDWLSTEFPKTGIYYNYN